MARAAADSGTATGSSPAAWGATVPVRSRLTASRTSGLQDLKCQQPCVAAVIKAPWKQLLKSKLGLLVKRSPAVYQAEQSENKCQAPCPRLPFWHLCQVWDAVPPESWKAGLEGTTRQSPSWNKLKLKHARRLQGHCGVKPGKLLVHTSRRFFAFSWPGPQPERIRIVHGFVDSCKNQDAH